MQFKDIEVGQTIELEMSKSLGSPVRKKVCVLSGDRFPMHKDDWDIDWMRDEYNDDMTHKSYKGKDIIAVYNESNEKIFPPSKDRTIICCGARWDSAHVKSCPQCGRRL